MVFLMCGKFDETGHFGIRLFHDEVIRLLPLLCLILFFRINSYGQIEAVVPEERDDFVLRYRYGLQVREDFLPEKIFDNLLVERLHVSVRIENDMVST